jgi:hypothetical protein
MIMNATPALLCLFVLSVAGTACGCKEEKVGGCDQEIVKIGTAMKRADTAPSTAAWIRIGSVAFAGEDIYRRAALDLTALLDSLGISIYERSDLIRMRSGSCWPPYMISFSVDAKMGADRIVRTSLLAVPVAGLVASAERPEDYGLFFITCGWGSTDRWTVWYPSPPARETPRR